MIRRLACALLALSVCAAAVPWPAPDADPTPPSKPHIVLISIDTLRADHLGCYGYERDTSPLLDRFAENAVLFEETISQAAVTAPAHMSLFTGLTPAIHRVFNMDKDAPHSTLSPHIPTMAEILTGNGYLSCGYFGGGNVGPNLGFDRGFDVYDNTSIRWNLLRTTKDPLAPVAATIERAKTEDKPLFLFLHHYLCHDPYLRAPKEERTRYLEKPVEGFPLDRAELGRSNPYEKFWEGVDFNDPDHLQHMLALYDGGIRYSDWVFGEIEALLKAHGIWDDAYVAVVSDHGEEFNEHGGRLHWKLFIETLHVPMLVKYPGGAHAGTRVAQPVRLFDLMPTLLEGVGIDPPAAIQATSLAPLLEEGGVYDPVIISYANQKPKGAYRVQEGDFAYHNQRAGRTSEWLFDRARDPAEQDNLARKNAESLKAMRALAKKLELSDEELGGILKANEGALTTPSPELIEELRGLGYIK